jgi:UDP-N-acetylenolpyruvoylglucosamine reductase
MQSNPIVEKLQEEEVERRKKADYRYPYRIVCVFEDSDNNDFPIILEVRDYCNKNNLIFSAGQYDHEKYADDMFIKRLPAFHFMHKNYVQESHHYDENPVHKIQVMIWAYQDIQRAKERARIQRQERWDTFKETMGSIFTLDHFKRKPALEKGANLSHDRIKIEEEKKD